MYTYTIRNTVFVWCPVNIIQILYFEAFFLWYIFATHANTHSKLRDYPFAHFISIYLVHCAVLFAIHLTVILQLAPFDGPAAVRYRWQNEMQAEML